MSGLSNRSASTLLDGEFTVCCLRSGKIMSRKVRAMANTACLSSVCLALRLLSFAALLSLALGSPAARALLPNSVARVGGKYDCMSVNECPIGYYCSGSGELLEFGECLPLVKENGECRWMRTGDVWIYRDESEFYGDNNCQAGLFCDYLGVCRRPARIGKRCDHEVYNSCEKGAYCENEKKKCKRQLMLGDPCDSNLSMDNPCLGSAGLFCKPVETPSGKGFCARKISMSNPGVPASGDWEECFGFHIEVGKEEKKLCMAPRLEGQLCTSNTQCRGERRPGSLRKDRVCNWIFKEMGFLPRYGVCAKERNLLRTAGDPCSPAMNLCDARRDLRCEKRGSRHVCVQNGGINKHTPTQCTPDSKFSKCPGQVCRQLTRKISERPYGPFFCLRKIEPLAHGEICSLLEHTHCKKGFECVKAQVRGISLQTSDYHLGYCVKRVDKGKKCGPWHLFACAEGTFCIDGKCVKSKDKPRLAKSLAGYGMSCKKKKCAPGLECGAYWGSRKMCNRPNKIVKLREACYETSPADKVCDEGLSCDDWEEHREGRCERSDSDAMGMGAKCGTGSTDSCAKGLICSSSVSTGWSGYYQHVCYNKSTILKIGDKCDEDESAVDDQSRHPHEGYPFPKCFIPAEEDGRALKCLPKGRSLVCQEEARLFEFCSAKYHIVCEKGLVCSPTMSICLGPSEIF